MSTGNLLIASAACLELYPPLVTAFTKIFNTLEIYFLSNLSSGNLLITSPVYLALLPSLAAASTKVFNALEISV